MTERRPIVYSAACATPPEHAGDHVVVHCSHHDEHEHHLYSTTRTTDRTSVMASIRWAYAAKWAVLGAVIAGVGERVWENPSELWTYFIVTVVLTVLIAIADRYASGNKRQPRQAVPPDGDSQ